MLTSNAILPESRAVPKVTLAHEASLVRKAASFQIRLKKSVRGLLLGSPHLFTEDFVEKLASLGFCHGRNIRVKVVQKKVDSVHAAQ